MSTHRTDKPSSRPFRVLRLGLLAAVLSALATPVALPSPVRAGEVLRSGTILSAAADTAAYTWVWYWEGCAGAPECLAWLWANCGEELAGRDPAVTSSIVPIDELADGVTPRTLELSSPAPGLLDRGRVVVEFWGRNCRHFPENRADYEVPCSDDCPKFAIPDRARWMTITSKPGNSNIEWTLT